jgi:threonine/homoserine/homoserine lactone efflux protein
MLDFSTLLVFATASLLLLFTPGPAVIYIVTSSVGRGRKAGIISVLGLSVGRLFHVAGAALGLSALLLSSALLFDLVKYLGAAYLIYLGIRTLRAKNQIAQLEELNQKSLWSIFSQGIFVNVLNPKIALFFFAYLPQFADASRGDLTLQIAGLGIFYCLMAVVTDTVYALLSSTFGNWLRGNARFWQIQRYVSGTVFIGLGISAALSNPTKK